MRTHESKSITSHSTAPQKPFFGASPEHAFFSTQRAQPTPFFQPQAVYTPTIQAKLTIGEPGDKYEQEADRVASQVVEQINTPAPAQSTQGQTVQRQEENKEELQAKPEITALQRQEENEEELQAKPEITALQRMEEKPEELQAKSNLQYGEAIGGGVSTEFETAHNHSMGSGQPLDGGRQESKGQAMGADFRGVRVHTEGRSDQLNKSRQAKALRTGQDVLFPMVGKENKTGVPDYLKSGMENLSGMNLDHVKVHYNSVKPAAVRAHAYAQGSDIHLAPGQAQHLPHELGHVVQQMQGRVKATTSVNGMEVNDNAGLESEATRMGKRALQRAGGQAGAVSSHADTMGVPKNKSVAQRADDDTRQIATAVRNEAELLYDIADSKGDENKLKNAVIGYAKRNLNQATEVVGTAIGAPPELSAIAGNLNGALIDAGTGELNKGGKEIVLDAALAGVKKGVGRVAGSVLGSGGAAGATGVVNAHIDMVQATANQVMRKNPSDDEALAKSVQNLFKGVASTGAVVVVGAMHAPILAVGLIGLGVQKAVGKGFEIAEAQIKEANSTKRSTNR